MRKLREFYRLNKDLFTQDGHYFLLVRQVVEDWPEFETRLKGLLNKLAN
jgi:hypothetical protein